MKGKYGVWVLLLVCVVLFPRPVLSAEAEGRVLGGYRFIPSSIIEDPFMTSHFRSATGLSLTSGVSIPVVIIPETPPDTLLSMDGDFLFVVASFEYQQRVHRRVTVRVLGSGASRVGTNGQSLVATGVTALFGVGLGATVALWGNDRVLLSGAADVRFANSLVVDMVQFAEDVIEGNVQNPSLVRTASGGGGDLSIRAAWAPTNWAGITGAGRLGTSAFEALESKALWQLGVSGSVDFGQRGQAPIGLLLSLDLDRMNPQVLNISTGFGIGLGVFYTGREDLNLGLEARWSRWPVEDFDVTVNPVSFTLALRYYF